MIQLIRLNKWFFASYGLFIIAGGFFILHYSKGDLLLLINSYHSNAYDFIFRYITQLGNGLFYVAIIILISLYSFRYAFVALLSYAVSGVFVQLLKHTFFHEFMRPVEFFSSIEHLHFVDGIKILHMYSFPSGHSASGFSLFCFLALMIPDKKAGIIFAILGILTCISRVYLVEHFFIDVYFGSLIGVIITLAIYWLTIQSGWLKDKSWADSSVLKLVNHPKKRTIK